LRRDQGPGNLFGLKSSQEKHKGWSEGKVCGAQWRTGWGSTHTKDIEVQTKEGEVSSSEAKVLVGRRLRRKWQCGDPQPSRKLEGEPEERRECATLLVERVMRSALPFSWEV